MRFSHHVNASSPIVVTELRISRFWCCSFYKTHPQQWKQLYIICLQQQPRLELRHFLSLPRQQAHHQWNPWNRILRLRLPKQPSRTKGFLFHLQFHCTRQMKRKQKCQKQKCFTHFIAKFITYLRKTYKQTFNHQSGTELYCENGREVFWNKQQFFVIGKCLSVFIVRIKVISARLPIFSYELYSKIIISYKQHQKELQNDFFFLNLVC